MKATTSLFWAMFFVTTSFAQSNFDSTFTKYFRRTNGWTAGDATISIPISPDSILWLFGDSYNGNFSNNTIPCWPNARNTVVLQRKSNPSQLKTLQNPNSAIKTFFKGSEIGNDTFFWPGHGYRYLDTVYIFLNRYHESATGTLAHLGTFLAKMSPYNLQLFSIQALHPTNDIIFGRWVFIPTTNDYAFIYGNKKFTVQYNNQPLEIWKPFVARTAKNNPLAPWKYKSASGWANSPSQAIPISDYGVSPGFSVIRRDNILYLVTQQNGYLQCGAGKDIYLLKGGVAHGDPFNQRKTVYQINTDFEGNDLSTYNAFSHPEWNHYQQGLLVSYNVNDPADDLIFDGCPFQCLNGNTRNADTYRPKFIRIPWAVITDGWTANRSDTEDEALTLNAEEFQLFPNPTSNQLSISLPLIPSERFTINVLDLSGKSIKSWIFEPEDAGQIISVDVSALPKGIYLLEIRFSAKQLRKKFIIAPKL
ncbi:MAG: T9SS type A sorting domain-containing protein [Saprospiraceae bacterium]|nr:T9SS type A sorting domain-containing protein [Saprospiraceae bacterium]